MAKSTGTGASGRSGGRVTRLLRTLLVLAVLAVAGMFGVRWALDRIDSTEAETTEVRTEIADLEVELARYLSLEELRLQLEAQLLAAQATLPPSPDLPGILDQIVVLAQSTGARLLSVLPSPPVPVSSPGADPSLQQEVPLDIKLAGTEEAVGRIRKRPAPPGAGDRRRQRVDHMARKRAPCPVPHGPRSP